MFSVPFGQQVVVIVRAYSPTVEELAFDPAIKDDLLVQRHYKTDYQYVRIPVRNGSGAITSTKGKMVNDAAPSLETGKRN
jgi:hypothetical protein